MGAILAIAAAAAIAIIVSKRSSAAPAPETQQPGGGPGSGGVTSYCQFIPDPVVRDVCTKLLSGASPNAVATYLVNTLGPSVCAQAGPLAPLCQSAAQSLINLVTTGPKWTLATLAKFTREVAYDFNRGYQRCDSGGPDHGLSCMREKLRMLRLFLESYGQVGVRDAELIVRSKAVRDLIEQEAKRLDPGHWPEAWEKLYAARRSANIAKCPEKGGTLCDPQFLKPLPGLRAQLPSP